MEKLIELLNEYEEYNKNCEFDEVYNYYPYRVWYEGDFETDLTENCMNIVFIMSKTFGFIKWLVENDKIDTHELLGIYWETRQSIWEDNKYELYSEYKRLLMLLSLQDEPIEFLRRLLK